MSRKVRTQNLTVLLLKEDVRSFDDALRNPKSLILIRLKPNTTYEGEFWYSPPITRMPGWLNFVSPVLGSLPNKLTTASVSAILFVRTERRIFAITFGHGRNLLKPDCYEYRFGLKVALNRVHHERLRSLDLRTYEDIMVITRKQTSRSAQLGDFGLDITRDILRAVTGEPEDFRFGKRLTGADALTITTQITVEQLGNKCKDILEAYNDNRYKQHFDWVDQLSEIKDPNLINILNTKLLESIKKRNTNNLYLAPPEAIDWQSVYKFRIEGTRSKNYDDLNIDDYLNALGDKLEQLTIQKLKSNCVLVCWMGSQQFENKWALFNCIVWETEYIGKLFALIEGKWFEIEAGYAQRVKAFVESITSNKYFLPNADLNESETNYIQRVSRMSPGLVCLDRVLVKPQDATTQIEFCDLLSDQKVLFYIKRKTRSATLSHLFAQGTVAARIFLHDGKVRKQIRDHLKKKRKKRFVLIIPDETTRPNPSEYEICYAVITTASEDKPAYLPFFSQLNLMQNARLLQELGYKVFLNIIHESQ